MPLISVAALGFLVFWVPLMWAICAWRCRGRYSRHGHLLVVAAPYVASLCLYLFFRIYRRRREGADVDLYFRDMPVGGADRPPPNG